MARTAADIGRLAARRMKVSFELPSLTPTLQSTVSGVSPGMRAVTSAYDGAKTLYNGTKSLFSGGGVKPVTPLGGNSAATKPFQAGLQNIGTGLQHGMGDAWTPEVGQAWGTLMGTYQPPAQPAPLTASQKSPGAFATGMRSLGRAKSTLQGAFGAGVGLLGSTVGGIGEAVAGKGGTMSALKDNSRTAMHQGMNQITGNLVGGLNDNLRYAHSWMPTIANKVLPERYAKPVENGYQLLWGDKPGTGLLDQYERKASGGTLDPLSTAMRQKSDLLRRIANSPQASRGLGMERLEANLYDTFAHPDTGLFGLATGSLATPGGGGAVSRLGSMAFDQLGTRMGWNQ